ncbi:Nitrilase family, member 2 [Seminavis robusta]|uniref:Nitrilase family, member 2 n=1 Tax=Seminavis robusta TaxID=568900 RepID=A0A9N8HSP5_9STRA|nr:Nitrilase family, member 2 [Seminavis robusta]|eukprot:Sro1472_g275510.1 Nitrilase family, member 2 (315) ;mRNA; f:18492-19436
MKKSDRERRTDASTCKMMPAGFVPGPYEILIGRGRRCTNHWGNQRFRHMIETELEGYAAAECKRHKSSIIGRVLADIKKHSPNKGFIKKDVASGRWLAFTDAASRVAIAQAFRDALDDTYKSSKHSKQVKRRMDKNVGMPTSVPFKFAPQSQSQEQQMPPLFSGSISFAKNDDCKMMDTSMMDDVSMRSSSLRSSVSSEKPEDFNFDPLPIQSSSNNGAQDLSSVGNDEFAALFNAFARNDVDMGDNPYEPFPLANASVSSISGDLLATPPMSPVPARRAVRRPAVMPFKSSSANGGKPFGNTPYRDVRAAMSA